MIRQCTLLTAGLLAATMALAGCADGPSAGAVDVEEFCAAVTRVDSFMPNAQVTEADSDAEFDMLLTAVERSAPSELRTAVEHLVTSVRELDDAPDDGMSAEALEANDRIDEYALSHCEVEQRIEVTVTDYELTGLPATVPGGRVAVTLHNVGAEVHMLQFVRVYDPQGRSGAELLALSEDEIGGVLEGGPGMYLTGGVTDTAFLELVPGRHLAVDPIPIGTVLLGTLGWGEPHYTRGMFTEVAIAGRASSSGTHRSTSPG